MFAKRVPISGSNVRNLGDAGDTVGRHGRGSERPGDFQFYRCGEKICGMPSPARPLAIPAHRSAFFCWGRIGQAGEGGIKNTKDHGSWAYVADEVLFSLCELGINYDLSKEEMLDYYLKTMNLLTQINHGQASEKTKRADIITQ